jgi:hypothetical protein
VVEECSGSEVERFKGVENYRSLGDFGVEGTMALEGQGRRDLCVLGIRGLGL